jgi:hypothetical protein
MPTSRVASLLLIVMVAACAPGTPAPSLTTLTLSLTAGPVCPVEQVPPDPNCAPRPVAGEVVAMVLGDREVARGTSDADGRIRFSLPAGRYAVRPIDDGTFPTPPAEQVVDVGTDPLEIDLGYDTGIR